MDWLKDFLVKIRFPVILALAGVLFVLLAQYSLKGTWNALQFQDRTSISIPYFVTGIGLIILAALLYLTDNQDLILLARCRLISTKTGFKTVFKETALHVDFGILQEIYSASTNSAIVLPTNEFFDDRCFNDPDTVCGSFIKSEFSSGDANSLQELVNQKLSSHSYEEVPNRENGAIKSYGTGTCIFLRHPLGTPHQIVLASVATDREEVGLRVEMVSIFQALQGIHRIIAEERTVSVLYLPLMGAGKGGVPAQLAFRALLIAALEARCAQGGHAIREVHVVVFKPRNGESKVPERKARGTVRELVTLYQQVSR